MPRVTPEALAGPERRTLRGYAQKSGQIFDEEALPKRARGAFTSVKTAVPKDWRREAYGRRPMSEIRADEPTAYVEDLETTLRVKGQADITGEANRVFRASVTDLGRPVRHKDIEADRLLRSPDEAVYTVKEVSGVRKLVEATEQELSQASRQAGRPGMKGGALRDFVVLEEGDRRARQPGHRAGQVHPLLRRAHQRHQMGAHHPKSAILGQERVRRSVQRLAGGGAGTFATRRHPQGGQGQCPDL